MKGDTPVGEVSLQAFVQTLIDQHSEQNDREFRAIREVIDEKDRRYMDRFTTSQTAIVAALAAQERFAAAALASAQIATDKAETNTKEWKAQANEWRGAMTDRERGFVSRDEHTVTAKNIEKKTDELSERINSLSLRLERSEGQGSGISATWVVLGQVIALFVSIGALLLAFARH